MTGPNKSDDEDVKPEEIAALAKGLRRSALRDSNPDIVATSNGQQAAAYHSGAAKKPPAATSKTIPTGGVKLSATLQRDIADLNKPKAPKPAAEGSARRFDVTVPGGPRVREFRRAAWIVGAMAVVLLVMVLVAVRSRKKPGELAPATPPPTASAMPAPAPPPSALATSPALPLPVVTANEPVVAPPAAAASASPVPAASRPHPAGHPSTAAPASPGHPGSGGSGEMINPPL